MNSYYIVTVLQEYFFALIYKIFFVFIIIPNFYCMHIFLYHSAFLEIAFSLYQIFSLEEIKFLDKSYVAFVILVCCMLICIIDFLPTRSYFC